MDLNARVCATGWLRVETRTACFAVAVENGRIIGGADYACGRRGVLGRELDAGRACRRFKAMGARLEWLPR